MSDRTRRILHHARWLLAAAMIAIGITHFTSPAGFVAIVPEALPWKLALVYISGIGEIAGGLGLLHPRTRRLAAWGLVLLYVSVFPANVNMAINHLPLGPKEVSPTLLWLRLPLQLVLIAWAWYYTRKTADARPQPSAR